MFAGALFYVALIALVATTILSAGLAMTRATITRMGRPYAAAGYQRAITSIESAVAADIRSGGLRHPAPTFTPLPAACANTACTYTTTATILVSQTGSATPGPGCDPAQTNCAPNVQTNAYVDESRLTAAITVSVHDASGALVATRSGTLVLRTMTAPPYVAIAGLRDGAFDDVRNFHAAGDDGGAPPATPDPCASTAPGAAGDTSVRVAYRNTATNACTDGSSWSDSSYSTQPSSSGWSE